jgi:dephospho-CoA kinase
MRRQGLKYRQRHGRPRWLGLTGGLASGKSTAAGLLRRMGLRVHDSDAAVRRISAGLALPAIARLCPQAVVADRLDRGVLAKAAIQNPVLLQRLEALLHPLVADDRANWAKRWPQCRQRWLVMEVPLLLETGLDRHCPQVLSLLAPVWLRQRRALKRPNFGHEQWQRLTLLQTSTAQHHKISNHQLVNGLGKAWLYRQLFRALHRI